MLQGNTVGVTPCLKKRAFHGTVQPKVEAGGLPPPPTLEICGATSLQRQDREEGKFLAID